MNSLKVLIVEDELITANDIRETLEKAGHTVIALARNQAEALAAAQQQLPDVALVDIHLGDGAVDGIGVVQALQQYPPFPIIYLTAHAEDPTFLRAKETNPVAYLLKPFRHRELALQVELAYYNYQIGPPEGEPQETSQPPKANIAAAPDLYLPIKKGYQRIVKADVLYVQADGAYSKIFFTDEKPAHIVTMNIGYMAQFFPASDFYRLSRSMLINLQQIDRIDGLQVFMRNHPTPLAIPEASRKDLLTKLPIVRTP